MRGFLCVAWLCMVAWVFASWPARLACIPPFVIGSVIADGLWRAKDWARVAGAIYCALVGTAVVILLLLGYGGTLFPLPMLAMLMFASAAYLLRRKRRDEFTQAREMIARTRAARR